MARLLGRGAACFAGILLVSYLACIGYAYWPYPERPREALVHADAGDRLIRVEGYTLRYRMRPSVLVPERPTLVMLHGFAGSLHAWHRVTPELAKVANVVAVDIMPFGLSDKPLDFDYAYSSQARIIGGLVDALDIRDPIPMGHSYGGTIAAYMAWKNPRVSRVVLVDPGIQSTGVPSFVRYLFFPMPEVGARMFGTSTFRRRFVSKSFVDKSLITDDLVRGLSLGTNMDGYLDGTAAFFSHFSEVDVAGLLQGIRAKALLVWGEKDRNNPIANAYEMAKHLPDATTAIIANSGHYPHEERPHEVVAAVSAFLQRTQPRAPVTGSQESTSP